MKECQRVCQRKTAAHSHKCGREMIKLLMRPYQQGDFYRGRGANSRNVQQRKRKERKAAVYSLATCVQMVNRARLHLLESVSLSPSQPCVKAQKGDQNQSRLY